MAEPDFSKEIEGLTEDIATGIAALVAALQRRTMMLLTRTAIDGIRPWELPGLSGEVGTTLQPPSLDRYITRGWDMGVQHAGGDIQRATASVQRAMAIQVARELAERWAGDVAGQVMTRTRLSVMAGDIRGLLGELRGYFGGQALQRLRSIAVTESLRAYSMGFYEVAQSLKTVTHKVWVYDHMPQYPRTGHMAAAGQKVPIKRPFMVAVMVGEAPEPLMYPRDPAASPRQVLGCGCSMRLMRSVGSV